MVLSAKGQRAERSAKIAFRSRLALFLLAVDAAHIGVAIASRNVFGRNFINAVKFDLG